MKKLLAIFLAFALLFSLAACDPESASDEDKKSNKTSFSKQVVVDNDDCKITITKLDLDDKNGPTLKAQLENKTEGTLLAFTLDTASINGVQTSAYLYQTVEAGEKETREIVFSDEALAKNDIGDYTDIELSFRVRDDSDWAAEPVAEETVHIYPYGEDKASKYVREEQKSDKVLIDNEYVSIVALDFEDENEYQDLNLYIVNKTDDDIEINADNVSVNGFMANPSFWYSVRAGKSAFSTITWTESALRYLDVGDFTDIEMTLMVYQGGNMGGEPYAKETVHYYPEGEDKAANFEYQMQSSDQILVDNEYVKIIATGCVEDEYAQVVNVLAINKSDKNIGIGVEDTSVNGLMLEAGYWCDITAGKAAYEWISWSNDDFEQLDLGGFTDIEMTFVVTDQDDWYAGNLAEETVHYYPEGEHNATQFNYTVQSSDTVLVENQYVDVIITSHGKDDWGEYTLSLFYENHTDTDLYIAARDVTVNGIALDPYYVEDLLVGKCAFLPMQWSSYTLEENNITEIAEITFTLEIDADYGWYTTNLVTESFTLQF